MIGQTLRSLQKYECIRRTISVSFPAPIHCGWFGSEIANNFITRMLPIVSLRITRKFGTPLYQNHQYLLLFFPTSRTGCLGFVRKFFTLVKLQTTYNSLYRTYHKFFDNCYLCPRGTMYTCLRPINTVVIISIHRNEPI